MPGIILRTTALTVERMPGGMPTKTKREEVKDALGRKRSTHRHYRASKRLPGSDYVVFKCPGCGARNRKSMYEAKGSSGDSLAFRCVHCYREIEVSRPAPVPSLITAAGTPAARTAGLVDPAGRPIGLGR